MSKLINNQAAKSPNDPSSPTGAGTPIQNVGDNHVCETSQPTAPKPVRCSAWLGDMVELQKTTDIKEDILGHDSYEGLQKSLSLSSDCSGLHPSPELTDRSGTRLRYNGWSAGAVEETTPNTYSNQYIL